jgi:uncharacterized protein (TIGR02466 family)
MNNNLKFNNFFPTVIAQDYDLQFTNQVLPIAQDILNKVDTKYWDYHTTYNNHNINLYLSQNHPFIIDKIKKLSKDYIDKIGWDVPIDILEYQLFVSRMKNKDTHDSHNHPNSLLSGVAYLNIEENSSPIIFHSANTIRSFSFHFDKKKETMFNQEIIPYQCKNGDILIWESWIPHKVPQNINLKGIRETLVFNIFWPKA